MRNVHQFSGNKNTENGDWGSYKEYREEKWARIGSKYESPLKKKYLKIGKNKQWDWQATNSSLETII